MLNSALKILVKVVQCGSFTKASEQLYLSPTAIMKQINTLEDHFKFKLLERKRTGVELTHAGKLIYQETLALQERCEQIIKQARALSGMGSTTISVGSSLLNPAKIFMDLWYQVNPLLPDYKLQIVPFEDTHEGILDEIKKVGLKYDFLIGVCDSRSWRNYINFTPVGYVNKMIAVTPHHPSAQKYFKLKKPNAKLKVSDLHGYTLMMIKEGDSPLNDRIRADLRAHHPQITIEDTPQHYDVSVFNRCVETDQVLLTMECWTEVHPALVSIPVEWDYGMPYGLIYAKDARLEVKNFLECAKQFIKLEQR